MQPHEQLLALLDESPIIKGYRTVELKIVDQETFSVKVRAKITDEFSLQIRYLQDEEFPLLLSIIHHKGDPPLG